MVLTWLLSLLLTTIFWYSRLTLYFHKLMTIRYVSSWSLLMIGKYFAHVIRKKNTLNCQSSFTRVIVKMTSTREKIYMPTSLLSLAVFQPNRDANFKESEPWTFARTINISTGALLLMFACNYLFTENEYGKHSVVLKIDSIIIFRIGSKIRTDYIVLYIVYLYIGTILAYLNNSWL